MCVGKRQARHGPKIPGQNSKESAEQEELKSIATGSVSRYKGDSVKSLLVLKDDEESVAKQPEILGVVSGTVVKEEKIAKETKIAGKEEKVAFGEEKKAKVPDHIPAIVKDDKIVEKIEKILGKDGKVAVKQEKALAVRDSHISASQLPVMTCQEKNVAFTKQHVKV